MSRGACAKETVESSTASHRVRQTSDTSATASGIIICRKHGPLLFSSVPCNMIRSCAAYLEDLEGFVRTGLDVETQTLFEIYS